MDQQFACLGLGHTADTGASGAAGSGAPAAAEGAAAAALGPASTKHSEVVGLAMLAMLRERFGQGLQGLAAQLQLAAAPAVNETRGSVVIAGHCPEAMRDAMKQLREVLQGLRAEAAREQTEVPIIGSTRCLLGPGGELHAVLTAGQHVTLAVSGAGAGAGAEQPLLASEAALRELFGRHGEVLGVRLLAIGGVHTARVTFASAAQAAAALAALHDTRLPGGGHLAVVGYQPPSARKVFRPANLLHLSWSGGRPSGVAFVEFQQGAAAVRKAVGEANAGPRGLGRRGMLRVGGGDAWFFAQASKASRRVLQVKVCGEERERQSSPPMALLRDPERLRRALAERFGPVSKLSVMQEPDPALRREAQEPGVVAARLRSLLQQYGHLVSLEAKPYDSKRQRGSAFASFSSAQECAAARQALDGSTRIAGWLSRQPLHAHSDLVCRLRLGGRCYGALRGRLAFEVEKLRVLCPGVKVSVKALDQSLHDTTTDVHAAFVGGAAGGGATGGGGACIKLQGSDVGQVVRAKQLLESATSGKLIDLDETQQQQQRGNADAAGGGGGGGSGGGGDGGEDRLQGAMLFVLSAPGKALIKQIEAEYSSAMPPAAAGAGLDDADGVAAVAVDCVHIRWDRALGQLRIYGSNDATIAAAEQRLKSALKERRAALAAPLSSKEALSQQQFRLLLAAGGQDWLDALREHHSLASAALAFMPLGVKLLGEEQAVKAARLELLALVSAPAVEASELTAAAAAARGTAAGGSGGGVGRGAASGSAAGSAVTASRGTVAAGEGRDKDGEAREEEEGEEACCPVCFCPPEGPHRLLLCDHTYCQPCVRQLLLAAASSNQLPARCCAAGCGSGVSLRDCLVLLGPEQMERVHRSAFNAYIGLHPEAYGCCLTPDCGQIYAKPQQRPAAPPQPDAALQTQQAGRRQRAAGRGAPAAAADGSAAGGAGGPTEPHFVCDCCLMSWCTACQVPWHAGQTCAEYKAGRQGDKEFEAWKRQNTMPCPRCKVSIEKSSGCNHMTCSKCKTHFCWKCGEEFANSDSTYDHLARRHGGIFDANYGNF